MHRYIVVYIKIDKKKMYQEAKLSDLIYKEKRNLYIVRLRDFTKGIALMKLN